MTKNNIKITLPEDVEIILKKLESHGHKAYAVGGCIRDSLMGRTPFDWDITTSATPTQVKEAFVSEKIFETGIKHGTITLVLEGKNYEITTFRKDGAYTDMRHPDSVTYSNDIFDDLSRRDFTVNAMAYSLHDGFVSVKGSLSDLENKIIRTVGDADKRFAEDALRILRALRFSSVLGFKIDDGTQEAILKNYKLLKSISPERIKAELFKMITGKNFNYICKNYKCVLNYVIKDADVSLISESFFDKNTTCDDITAFSAIANLTSKAPVDTANSLKPSNYEKSVVKTGATPYENTKDRFTVLKLISDIGENNFLTLVNIWDLMGYNTDYYVTIYNEAKVNNLCLSLNDMAVGGEVFSKYFKGEEISRSMKNCLYAILNGDISNTKEDILKYISHSLLLEEKGDRFSGG